MPTSTDYSDWEMQGKVQKLPKELCEHCDTLVYETTPCFYEDDEYKTDVWCCDDCIDDTNNLLMAEL